MPELLMGVGGGRWGVDVPGLQSALLAQVDGSDVRDKRDFFLQEGQKFRLPRPPWGLPPVSYRRYVVPRTLGVHVWRHAGSGRSWLGGADRCPLHSWALEGG